MIGLKRRLGIALENLKNLDIDQSVDLYAFFSLMPEKVISKWGLSMEQMCESVTREDGICLIYDSVERIPIWSLVNDADDIFLELKLTKQFSFLFLK